MTVEDEMKILEEINKEIIKKGRLLYSYEIKEILDQFIVKYDNAPAVEVATNLQPTCNKLQGDMLPVGTTFNIKPEDIKLNGGDQISRKTIEKIIVGMLEKWADGYCYIEIPTDDAIKEMKSAIDYAETVEPEKVLLANVTFDEDKLKEIVQTEVIDKIKSGKLVVKKEDRPQGEWIITEELKGAGGIVYRTRKCNKCGWEFSLVIPRNFCPNCGAKMKGEEE